MREWIRVSNAGDFDEVSNAGDFDYRAWISIT